MKNKVLFVFTALFLCAAWSMTTIYAGEKYAGERSIEPINMSLNGSILKVDDFGRTIFDINLKGAPGKANARGVLMPRGVE